MRRAVLLTGLIRARETCAAFLDGLIDRADPDLPVIVSTWTGELDRYPDIRSRLARLDATVAEQAPPDLKLPGHILHQALSLDLGLSLLADDCFVFKARPDICNIGDVAEFLAVTPERLAPGRLAAPFGHRVLTVGMFAMHPLYINDVIFAGMAGDLRRLAQIPVVYGPKYPRLAPEQWLWGAAMLGANPVLEAFLSVNPGLVFDDAGRNAALRAVLTDSPLFARAMAVNAILVRDSLGFLHPDPRRAEIVDRAGRHTLEELLWDRTDEPAIDCHKLALVNTFLSEGLMDVVHDGLHRSSDLGERVRAAMQRYGGADGARWLAYDRPAVTQEAVALGQALASEVGLGSGQAPDDQPGLRRVHRGPSPWQLISDNVSDRAALEAEINQLRRTVEQMARRITPD